MNSKMNEQKIMYFWYLTQCEPVVHICFTESPNRDSPGPQGLTRSLTISAIHDYPAIRWEVSPGYHLWGERKSGEENALPLLVTGDRQARKPANDGIPHTAVEVLTELANDLVSGAGDNRFPR